jgi:hypothetical protein
VSLTRFLVGKARCAVPVAERSVRQRNRIARARVLARVPPCASLRAGTAQQRAVPTKTTPNCHWPPDWDFSGERARPGCRFRHRAGNRFQTEWFHVLPHPGLLPKEKEKRAPRLWKYSRRDWPDGLPNKLAARRVKSSPGGEETGEGGRPN